MGKKTQTTTKKDVKLEKPKVLPPNSVKVTPENASLILCKQIEALNNNVIEILKILSDKKDK